MENSEKYKDSPVTAEERAKAYRKFGWRKAINGIRKLLQEKNKKQTKQPQDTHQQTCPIKQENLLSWQQNHKLMTIY